MAWIEGTEEQTFVVNASYQDVVDFFNDPATFRECLSQIESAEEVEEGVWHWVLEEKAEKGIKYQADYTVKYETTDDGQGKWHTLEGNMRSEGVVECSEVDEGRTEVHYKETIATDLPIPKLMAKVFRPIVAREIRKGVGSFLDCARARFGS
jgi:carbon monoxide dehydrogenase subunit G